MSTSDAYLAPTFAERKAAREATAAPVAVEPKAVTADEDSVEDKAVTSSESKKRGTPRKKS